MTAIIPAAGLGTRFLPVTRVVPKEMLPIGSKPALELIVDEAIAAGADEIIIVISHGKELIREYFNGRPSIRFAYQEEQRGLGDAVLAGLKAAKSNLAESGENVLILLGDALVSKCCAAEEMVKLSVANGGAGVIGCERVPREKISRYGILSVNDGLITDLVEKPSPEEAPSDLAIAGRYLLPAKIIRLLESQTPGKGGEIQLTDSIRRLVKPEELGAKTFPVLAYTYPGKRQDIGNPKGYLEALKEMGENA
jgi:UTP--glucose-1-phosphate uridylyltransferase